jgi:acetylserotonin N-methyltransferase
VPLPDPEPVTDLIEAFRCSKIMFAAVSLGVFDQLHKAPARAAEIATVANANADATERLLDACCMLGLLEKSDGVYSNAPAADTYLVSSSPSTLAGYVQYSDAVLYPIWGNLLSGIRHGTHQWKTTFGFDGPIFSHFFHTEEAMRGFLRGMHGYGQLTSPRVVAAFDLGRFRRLVDLGGATGHLTIAACEHYPKLRGVVFDLEGPAKMAREQAALSPAHDRIEVIEGDFFRDELPDADLFALGRILHDWSEEKIDLLLRKIFTRLPDGGALLVAEQTLNDDGIGPPWGNLQSLNMLLVTEGRERTLADYRQILERAGFASVEGRKTGATLDAILAIKTGR